MRNSVTITLIGGALAVLAAGTMAAKAAPRYVPPLPAGYPADKWRYDQAEQEWRANNPPVSKNKIAETLPPTHAPTLQKLPRNGIDDTPTNGPTFKRLGIKVLNSWHGTVTGQDVDIFAGAIDCQQEQGVECARGAGIIIVGTHIQGTPKFETILAPSTMLENPWAMIERFFMDVLAALVIKHFELPADRTISIPPRGMILPLRARFCPSGTQPGPSSKGFPPVIP